MNIEEEKKINLCDKYKELPSVIVISLVMLFAFVTVSLVNAVMGNSEKLDNTVFVTSKAEEYFYNREYDKAINEYKELQSKEDWPIYNVKIAEIYSVQGQIEKSNTILEESVIKRYSLIDEKGYDKFKDKDNELCNDIVFTYFMNGEYKKALETGEMFLEENGENKELQRTMISVYMVNNKKDKAKQIINEYEVDVASAYDLATLARMKMLIDEWDDGFELLRKAWYIDKDEVKVYDVIAQISAYNRNEIIKRLSELSKNDPEEICYKVWLTKAYSMLESTTNEASKLLTELEGEDLGNTVFNTVKAKIYQHSGMKDEAEKLLKDIISSKEESYVGYHTAAWYYYDLKDYDRAFEYCKKSIVENKEYPDNYGFLVPEIMNKLEEPLTAEPYLRTALSKEPFNYNIILKIADYYWNTEKNTEKAYYYFKLASLIKPNDAEIYYNMAMIKLTEEKSNEAIDLLKKSISIDKSVSKYHRTLGTVYLEQEKNNEAIAEIRESYALDKKDILTLNNAGCYYLLIDGNIERSLVNLEAAFNGITSFTDAETKNTITENYNKVKEIKKSYENYDGREIQLPDLQLFY